MAIEEILAAAEELAPEEQVELLGVMIGRYSPPPVPDIAKLERRRREMRKSGDVYRWTDSNGRSSYIDRQPCLVTTANSPHVRKE